MNLLSRFRGSSSEERNAVHVSDVNVEMDSAEFGTSFQREYVLGGEGTPRNTRQDILCGHEQLERFTPLSAHACIRSDASSKEGVVVPTARLNQGFAHEVAPSCQKKLLCHTVHAISEGEKELGSEVYQGSSCIVGCSAWME